MLLSIKHVSEYRYDAPVIYGLQRLRKTPKSRAGQFVREWETTLEGAHKEASYTDHFGNVTDLVSIVEGSDRIVISASGTVETTVEDGIVGEHRGYVPLWLFLRPTVLTKPDDALNELAQSTKADDELASLHTLMAAIAERVTYTIGSTQATTSATEALAAGNGVCQDHAHIFCAAARVLGIPARYVSGFLKMDGQDHQAASHAWAEAHVTGLGWVGFDVSNGISPDERYVCVATGLDYADAAPILGIRHGTANESLSVAVTVEQ